MQSFDSSDTSIVASDETMTGRAYLVEERRPKVSLEMCEKFISEGGSVLIVSRDPPSQLMSGTLLVPSRAIWLTNLVGKDRMNPTAIGILMSEIKKFIDQSNHRAVVLIDGIEYLISLNTYDRMLQFISQLRDMVVTSGAILIMPMDMRTLSDREQALLERNLQVVATSATVEVESAEHLYRMPSGEGIGT